MTTSVSRVSTRSSFAERRSYLDHASTSPLRPQAAGAMIRWLEQPHGDPSRIHAEGMTARVAIEEAREQVAAFFGARSREVVFTSGATEAIASATWGASDRGHRMVLSPVEHSAAREASTMFMGRAGGEVVEVPVDELGRVDVEAIAAAIDEHTALVHLQWGNHEVGTVQPVRRGSRAVPRTRRSAARRCRPSEWSHRDRLPSARCRSDVGERPQVRRPTRDRSTAGAPRIAYPTAARRWRSGTSTARRVRERPRHRRFRRSM